MSPFIPAVPKTIPLWQKNMRYPFEHGRGIRWPASVLPNNLFFFAHSRKEQMTTQGVTYVLHHRYELVIPYRGSARAVIGDNLYEMTPGTAHWVRPGEFHTYFDFEPGAFHWLFFSFDLDPNSPLFPRDHGPVLLEENDFALLDEVGGQYTRQVRDGVEVYAIARQMADIMLTLMERPRVAPFAVLESDPAFSNYLLFKKVALAVHERIFDGVRIHDLAEHLGMSEGHLRKTFREMVGVSLGSWLRHSKMSYAVTLVAHSGESISEIARKCGFLSIHSFSQAFSNKIGMAPTAYRKYIAQGGAPLAKPEELRPAPTEEEIEELPGPSAPSSAEPTGARSRSST